MNKIFALPEEEKFYFEVFLFQNKDQLGEWVDEPELYLDGLYEYNTFEDNNYFRVGRLFLFEQSLESNNLAGLAVDAAMSFATLVIAFSDDKNDKDNPMICKNTIIKSTKHLLEQLEELKQNHFEGI